MMEEQNYIQKALEDKKKIGKLMKRIAIGFGVLILTMLLFICIQLIVDMTNEESKGSDFFDLIALAIIVVWIAILISYYAWAIYFYNINLGLTDEDWAEIREKNKYQPEGANEERQNPNLNQTLGLPTGTVRGTIALTLLIGGVAMTIAGLGMKNTVDTNSFLVDNFEFFKTAFLMMIAFYFGNKSLEMLGYTGKKDPKKGPEANADSSTNALGDSDAPPPAVQDAGNLKKIYKVTEKKIDTNEPAKAGDPDFDDNAAML